MLLYIIHNLCNCNTFFTCTCQLVVQKAQANIYYAFEILSLFSDYFTEYNYLIVSTFWYLSLTGILIGCMIKPTAGLHWCISCFYGWGKFDLAYILGKLTIYPCVTRFLLSYMTLAFMWTLTCLTEQFKRRYFPISFYHLFIFNQ